MTQSLQEKMAASIAAKKQSEAAGTETSKTEGAVLEGSASTSTTELTGTGDTTLESTEVLDQLTAEDQALAALLNNEDTHVGEYQAAALPPEVLAQLMEKQEFAGLTGPITEDVTAEDVIQNLQASRDKVVAGKLEMPLEVIDRAIHDIRSTSDALMYDEQLAKEVAEQQKIRVQAEEEVNAIALSGGDVAATPLVTKVLRVPGDYSYIPGETILAEDINLDKYIVMQETADNLKNARQLIASHLITIARLNSYAASQLNDVVVLLDSDIARLEASVNYEKEAEGY